MDTKLHYPRSGMLDSDGLVANVVTKIGMTASNEKMNLDTFYGSAAGQCVYGMFYHACV